MAVATQPVPYSTVSKAYNIFRLTSRSSTLHVHEQTWGMGNNVYPTHEPKVQTLVENENHAHQFVVPENPQYQIQRGATIMSLTVVIERVHTTNPCTCIWHYLLSSHL